MAEERGSITISITIPKQLEGFMQDRADVEGISRSRKIGNVLLSYQKRELYPPKSNICTNSDHLSFCATCNITCRAPQTEAMSCAEYTEGTVTS